MAPELVRAIERFVEACPYVVAIYDLLAKVRITLEKGYFLNLYYNATLGKYAYTLCDLTGGSSAGIMPLITPA
ncbi:MAG: hypothetical protein ACUVV0_04810 [Anaerolineae bacterium]